FQLADVYSGFGYSSSRRVGIIQANHHCLTAAVEEEVAHRKTEGVVVPETAEDVLEIAKAVQNHGLVGGAAYSPPDECGDGRRHSCDGADATGEFLNIYSRVTEGYGHDDASGG